MSTLDDDFIQRMMERSVSDDEFSRKMSGLDPAKQQNLRALKAVMNETSSMKIPSGKSQSEIWESLQSKIDLDINEVKVVPIFRNRMLISTIAASILLIAVAYFALLSEQIVNFDVQKGDLSSMTLPDGSNLVINAESKISYDNRRWKKNRKVTLEGEAHFEVKKGSTFEVITSLGSVQVVGTSFNVLNRAGKFEVSCYEGEVLVTLQKSKNAVNLFAGEFTSLQKKALSSPKTFDQIKQRAWQKGEFYFDSSPLSEVFEEFERQFNVRVDVGNIEGRVYTGHYRKGDMNEALQLICAPMGLSYEIMDEVTVHVF